MILWLEVLVGIERIWKAALASKLSICLPGLHRERLACKEQYHRSMCTLLLLDTQRHS
jgi:hypothetical protein